MRRHGTHRRGALAQAQAMWRIHDQYREVGDLAAAAAAMREAMRLERDARIILRPAAHRAMRGLVNGRRI